MRPRLALVPGEPGGVGPELCVRLAQRPAAAALVAYADPDTLLAAAARLDLPLRLRDADADTVAGELALHPVPQARPVRFGEADPANAPAVIAALTDAAAACLRGECHGLVTGPVHKASINAGGIPYTGTTELLARQAGSPGTSASRGRIAVSSTSSPRAPPGGFRRTPRRASAAGSVRIPPRTCAARSVRAPGCGGSSR